MKRILFLTAFILMMTTGYSQMYVIVTGTVSDSLNGTPIPNYPVTIYSDSTNGFVFYNTVYTNNQGLYTDTITPSVQWGLLYVQVYDCNQVLHYDTCNFAQGNEYFVKNFSICYNNAGCDADFSSYQAGFLSVQFTDQSINASNSWYWNFGDGSTSQQQNPYHTFPSPGTYQIKLVIGQNTTCIDSTFQTIVISDSTSGGCNAAFVAYPDSNSVQTYSFFDQSTGNIISWWWNFGDPASGPSNYSTVQNPSHTFTQPGWYIVCLTVQGADSLCYDVTCDTLLVGNNSGCQAQFSYYPDSLAAQGYPVQFIDLSSGTPSSWFWEFGDGGSSNEQNPYHIFNLPGTYYICLTIECQGVTSTWCQNIVVYGGNNCTSYFTYQQADLLVSFSGFMVNGVPATYSWSFGDGSTGTGQNVTHQYASVGIYYVSLTTVNQNGCQYQSGQSIMVGDSGEFHQVYGQVFAGSFPLTFGMALIMNVDTANNNFPFYDVATIDSMGVYYFPMVPNGNYVVYAIPFDSGLYLPTYYGDVLYWEDATVIELGEPANPYNINLILGSNMMPGPGTISGQINTGDFTDGMVDKITMMLMDQSYNVGKFVNVDAGGVFEFEDLSFGTYLIHAELAGCTSDLITVEITEENPEAEIVLTYSGGQILGLKEQNRILDAGSVYPNPAADLAYLVVKNPAATTITAEIFDLSGRRVVRVVEDAPAGNYRVAIPVSNLPTGLYNLRVYSEDGMTASRKIVISR